MSFKMLLRTAVTILCCTLLLQGGAWAVPYPLNKIPVPEPAGLSRFVKDKGAAIRLGKALFWDMQAGSDGVQACASCHYSAGADSRLTNQLNPAPPFPPAFNPAFEVGTGPNYTLLPADFPFFQVSPVDGRLTVDELTGEPDDPNTVITRDSNDIGGSQGIALADFLAINEGDALDSGTPRGSLLFGASRQVTGRNAPSVINAVFNFTNFWDGSAHNIFNGETPLGPLDVTAGIWVDDGAGIDLVKEKIALDNASLASQATGPPVNDVMMSFVGRSFPELGRKLLSLSPLDRQLVHPNDSVLGTLARADLEPDGSVTGGTGLSTSYSEMIRDAFQDDLWISDKTVTLDGESYDQIEANFPLFWGLSLQLYQATLVSDRTPFDRFLGGNADALSLAAQNGYLTFADKCAICHTGSELTSAAVGSSIPLCTPPDCNPAVFANNTTHKLIAADLEPETFEVRLIDAGFFNLGVRPTAEDPGRGANAPVDDPSTGLPFPLSFTRLAQMEGLPFATPQLPPGAADLPVAVDGAFKTPGLRNVELTAPYFHNGSMLTLEEVVEFYARGGNFPGNAELALNMQPVGGLRGNVLARAELVEFLKSLTDERVRNERAPFDHPQLLIPSGDAADTMITLAPTGGGDAVSPPLLVIAPFATPTTLTTLAFGGTVDPGSTVEIQVNALPSRFATVAGGTWTLAVTALPVGNNTVNFTARSATGGIETQSLPLTVLPVALIRGAPVGGTNQTGATLSVAGAGVASYRVSVDGAPFSAEIPVATPVLLTGLADGSHTVSVLGSDVLGNQQPAGSPTTATWIVKATPPILTLAELTSPTRLNSQTIGGTVELGSIPQVVVAPPGQAGAVRTIGGTGTATWSCDITGLAEGGNAVTVTARDFVFNTTVVTGTLTLDTVPPPLTLDELPTPARATASQLLTGSTEAGIVPLITVAGGTPVAPDSITGGTWSYRLGGLPAGVNRITVASSDAAGNQSTVSAEVELVRVDGNLNGTGEADLSDALTALRIAVGLVVPTPAQLLAGDVAPLVDGVPAPDDRIEIADALTILRKVVGLLSF